MTELIFERDDTKLVFTYIPWDTIAFERKCYELTFESWNTRPDPSEVIAFISSEGIETVVTRLDASGQTLRPFLWSLRFFHAGLQLDYMLSLPDRRIPGGIHGHMRPAEPDDRNAILQIAGTAYTERRFSDITGATQEKLGTRYRNWTAQILDNFPKLAHVYEFEGEVVGYMAAEEFEDKPNYVNLTLAAVSTVHSGAHGHGLIASALAAYSRQGYMLAGASLSADNLAILNIYASLEARFIQAVDFFLWNSET